MNIPGRGRRKGAARLEQAPDQAPQKSGRALDREATKRARTVHAKGVQRIRELFGADPKAATDLIADRRRSQGKTGTLTTPTVTRPERRAAGKRARAARRGRTLRGRTGAKQRKARTPKGGTA